MAQYADLELGLGRAHNDDFRVDFRYSLEGGDTDIRPADPRPMLARFDWQQLESLKADPAAYGKLLSQALFADEALRSLFAQARTASESSNATLRLRLAIDPGSPELHGLRWETLADPGSGALLATSQRVLFTRYLASQDWRSVKLHPQHDLRALLVIANPTDLAEYNLAPIDAAGELQRARTALGDLPITDLAPGSASLENLAARLREDYDILYLVCHGALDRSRAIVCLEDAQGKVRFVEGDELVTRIAELQTPPRLVVLASCQSAGMQASDEGVLSALGPRLAAAGVAAVVAMQGSVTQQTVAQFMPVFFQELRRDGQIDRAMAAARGAVRERADSWMPVLFMRLRSGRISYRPGFGDERESLRRWPALVGNIAAGQCTPIIGPGATEWLLGSRREIAVRWAEASRFPLNPGGRESLPQVAEYVAVDQDVATMQRDLRAHLVAEMRQRFGGILSPAEQEASFDDMISAVGRELMALPAMQPLRTLAALPLPIYITTMYGNSIADALAAAGKQPVVEICLWNDHLERQPSIFTSEPGYRPTPQRPLVYHLFGRLTDLDSLVLTEDNYFDYLIGVTSRNDLIPGVVRRALTDSALLFLGFELDEWDFRVLFRSIMSREGRNRRSKYAHVAAQIDPEGSRFAEPQRAREYLESYFDDADISIFWGSVADFGRELEQRVRQP